MVSDSRIRRAHQSMEVDRSVRKAVLLAAGRGSRLGDLTKDRPKPMVEVAGIPILEHILTGLIASGILEFLFVVGYRREAIQSYFQSGQRWNTKIDYAVQDIPNGTGSALLLGREFAGEDSVFASFGDILTAPAHYAQVIDEFESHDCSAVVGIVPMDPSQGAAAFHEDGRLLAVKEKPGPGEPTSNWNVSGVSAYSTDIWPALAALRPSKRGEYEITDAIASLIAGGQSVRVAEMNGFWSDVGTPDALASAEESWPKLD